MRILVFGLMLPSERRRSFVHRLEEMQERGHDIEVLSFRTRYPMDTSLTVRPIPSVSRRNATSNSANWFFYTVFALCWACYLHMQERFDLVRADFGDLPGFAAGIFSSMTSIPFFLYCHGRVAFEERAEAVPEAFDRTLLQPSSYRYWTSTFALWSADTVAAVSDFYGRLVGDEVVTLYPGVSIEQFKRRGEPDEFFLFAASLHDVKNAQRMVKIFEEGEMDRRLVVVGDGPVMASLQHGKTSVSFRGVLRTDELSRSMAAARLFVMPSRYETFGVVYLEAMAAGCPIICTSRTGITEVIEDGEHGIVLEAVDGCSIRQAISDIDEEYERMADAARAKAEQFSVERTCDRLERLCYWTVSSRYNR